MLEGGRVALIDCGQAGTRTPTAVSLLFYASRCASCTASSGFWWQRQSDGAVFSCHLLLDPYTKQAILAAAAYDGSEEMIGMLARIPCFCHCGLSGYKSPQRVGKADCVRNFGVTFFEGILPSCSNPLCAIQCISLEW